MLGIHRDNLKKWLVVTLVVGAMLSIICEGSQTEEHEIESVNDESTTGFPSTENKKERSGLFTGPRCTPGTNCSFIAAARDEYFFEVQDDQNFVIQFLSGKYFELYCKENQTLEMDSLPRFDPPVKVASVVVRECPVPEAGYAHALGALGVVPRDDLTVNGARGAVIERHLAGLRALRVLELRLSAPAPAPPAIVAGLRVRSLRLEGVRLAAPLLPPAGLRALALAGAGPNAVPPLRSLPMLERLVLNDDREPAALELPAAASLREVFLDAPLSAPPALGRVQSATLVHVRAAAAPLECGELQHLAVTSSPMHTLPVGWLRSCGELRSVALSWLDVRALPSRLLSAPALGNLSVHDCSYLTALPSDLFEDARAVRRLVLARNALEYLSSDNFGPLEALEWLDLSGNRLSWGVGEALRPLLKLQVLLLDGNPCGDLCPTVLERVSALSHMTALQRLGLARTGATRLCTDWVDGMPRLVALDLRHNRVAALHFRDLRFTRDAPAEVDLRGNPVAAVEYTRADYAAVVAGETPGSGALVVVRLDAELPCDCRSYWAALALQARPTHAALLGVHCEGGGELAARAPESLSCSLAGAGCPAPCACFVRPDAVVLRCSAPPTLPLPLDLPPATELRLAGANLTRLDPAHLSHELKLVDLTNNSIEGFDEETIATLFVQGREVLLAGNPLRCDCGQRSLITTLATHRPPGDRDRLRCADGRLLVAFALDSCAPRALLAPLGGALLAALVAASAVGALVARRRRVLVERLKGALAARGLCLGWALRPAPQYPPDAHKLYDAFVSCARADRRWVGEWLVPQLEAAGYRVCVPSRDWAPGELLAEQIETSVRAARLTLAVAPPPDAPAPWARAAARSARALTARDGRPRLLVLARTGDTDQEDALRRDDPLLWLRLVAALGRPQARGPPTVSLPVTPALALTTPS